MEEKKRKDEIEAPETGVIHIDGFPPIILNSDCDADHVDIIRDMRAEGYFDDDM